MTVIKHVCAGVARPAVTVYQHGHILETRLRFYEFERVVQVYFGLIESVYILTFACARACHIECKDVVTLANEILRAVEVSVHIAAYAVAYENESLTLLPFLIRIKISAQLVFTGIKIHALAVHHVFVIVVSDCVAHRRYACAEHGVVYRARGYVRDYHRPAQQKERGKKAYPHYHGHNALFLSLFHQCFIVHLNLQYKLYHTCLIVAISSMAGLYKNTVKISFMFVRQACSASAAQRKINKSSEIN